MLRSDMLTREKWANLGTDLTSMAHDALIYLKYTSVEELDRKRDLIRTFDLKGAERRSAGGNPEAVAEARAMIDFANDALRQIDEHEATIRRRCAEAPEFSVGTRVRVKEDIWELIGSPTSSCPEVGIIGVIAEKDEFDREHVSPLRVKVQFTNDLLGYEVDGDYPLDDEENTIRYFLHPFVLEAVDDDAVSYKPYTDDAEPEPEPTPAEEGMRYGLFTADGSEVCGHGHHSYAGMAQRAQDTGWELRQVAITDLDRKLGCVRD
jgi:hypothetical protein